MTKYSNQVTVTVDIEIIPEAFTEEAMEEFRSCISQFYEISEHVAHISELVALGMIEEISEWSGRDQFVEGYAEIGQFVKSARIRDIDTDLMKND